MDNTKAQHRCGICHGAFGLTEVVPVEVVREAIATDMATDHPHWTETGYVCKSDLANYRIRHVKHLLATENGEVTDLEKEVLASLERHELLSKNTDTEESDTWTFGEKLADRVASFGGSWTFLVCFAVFMALWIVLNAVVLVAKPVDPYPFILLNLLLSCLAAIQAPIIMMSQNRQEAKDRIRAQHDYQINLKAELEIRHLHEKIDHLLSHQWNRLAEIQEIQLELLAEINKQGR